MKVLHASYSAYPDPPGGTEVYVEALCTELAKQGVEGVITAPGPADEALERSGHRVRTFAVSPAPTLDQIYGAADADAAQRFGALLEDEAPDLVHQHALTPACSSELSRQAKRLGIPVVFTYHTPAVSCQRGTMMLWATEACDGHLDVGRCAACTLHGLGAGLIESRVLAHLPVATGRVIGKYGASGGAWTALRMSSLIAFRHHEVRAMFELADQIVVLAPWVEGVLRSNGVPAEKLTNCAHGIRDASRLSHPPRRTSSTLRLAHLGRLDPIKGTRILIDALRAATDVDLSLDVFGVAQHPSDRAWLDDLHRAAGDDPRIRFLAPIANETVIPTLAEYDLVVVPSQGMETGPLVVLEAFAAGVPVLGSALGGVADKVRHGENGLLVRPHDSVDAWRVALRLCSDPTLVRRLIDGVRRPRSMSDVATEMHALYARLVHSQDSRAATTIAAELN